MYRVALREVVTSAIAARLIAGARSFTDELVEAAMRLYGTRSVEETVDLAFRRLVGAQLSVDEAIAMEGSGWEGDLDRMREDSPPRIG
jgi:Arc/MetJ family transcription regulator